MNKEPMSQFERNKLRNEIYNFVEQNKDKLSQKEILQKFHNYQKQINFHNVIELIDPNGSPIWIDEDIVELIQLLWELKIYTYGSCQDTIEAHEFIEPTKNKGISIQFNDGNSAKKFLDIITDYDDPNDKSQIYLWNVVNDEEEFIISTNIVDNNSFIIKDIPEEYTLNNFKKQGLKTYPKHDFNVNIYFNPKYKQEIIDKLKKYLEKE